MIRTRLGKAFLLLMVLELLQILPSNTAQAVPSFARQTGIQCNQCHTVFPELTPFGRIFKLGGYVLGRSGKPYESPPPLAGMAQVSYTESKGLTSGVAPFDSTNRATDRINLPQQLSLFYGGRIYGNVGAFVQGTYDGASNKVLLDIADIRYSDNTLVWSKNLVYGLTLNNSPTAQDVWNTTPAWGFPFASSSVASTPAAGAMIDGALDQQVGGLGAYVLWNNLIYLEGTAYRTVRNGITKPLGAGTATEQVVDGVAPYWRLALERRWKNHFFTIGAYGIQASIFPAGDGSGPTNRFTDIAFDAQYQFLGTIEAEHMQMPMGGEPAAKPMPMGGEPAAKPMPMAGEPVAKPMPMGDRPMAKPMPMGDEPAAKPMPMAGEPAAQAGGQPMAKAGKHMITAHATWIHESQDWEASFPLGYAANPSDSLNTFRMNFNYYYRSDLGDIGGSIGNFSTTGKTDQLLYSPVPVEGSRTGSPNSNGFILEADYRPWEKTKFSLQYIIYDKFNGAHSDYDGFGRNASDNNTLYAVVWVMF